ncbi:hypothetical protein, partial [Vibrio cholerae]|uniref:hypothetical protein n=1 Tax=Vibrio cholerae TaxID=666 RepID=UPI0039C9BFAD
SPSLRLLDHFDEACIADIGFRLAFLRHLHILDHIGAESSDTHSIADDTELVGPLAFRINLFRRVGNSRWRTGDVR